ncbi:MAG: hypothetical protein RRC07_05995 [Anaerolineae bacterium]|nr:hypothetical protein [Anaerolineae bacterium]
MIRIILVLLTGGLLAVMSGCGGSPLEPTAPALDSQTAPQVIESGTAGETGEQTGDETDDQRPAKPATVDFSEIDSDDREEEPMEAPAPGGRDPETMLVEQARVALAERLGLEADDVIVSSVEAVTWPDSALGCPAPDMMYLQVLTPGYRIVLEVGGTEYTYHTDRSDQIVLCGPDGQPVE